MALIVKISADTEAQAITQLRMAMACARERGVVWDADLALARFVVVVGGVVQDWDEDTLQAHWNSSEVDRYRDRYRGGVVW